MSKYDTNSHHVSIGNVKDAKWVGQRVDKFFYEMLDKTKIYEDTIKMRYLLPTQVKIDYDLLINILNSNT